MNELKELCKSVKKFDEVLTDLSNYIISDEEPPDSKQTVQGTRDEIHVALNDLTARHSAIDPSISSASKNLKINKQLLENIEGTVKKRETYLSKYGFKLSEVERPAFPSRIKVQQVQPSCTPESKPGLQETLLKAQTPHKTPSLTSSEALIAKYTPAKKKVSPGEETFVIHHYSASDLTSSRGFEDRMARYSIAPNQILRNKIEHPVVDNSSSADVIGKYARSTTSFAKPQPSTALAGFDERMARYSIAPDSMTSKNKRPPGEIEPDQTSDRDTEPKVRKIGDLLSKYSRPKCTLNEVDSGENVTPAATPDNNHPTFKTPLSIRHLKMTSQTLDDSLPIGFSVNRGREYHYPGQQEEDLEQTINLGDLASNKTKPQASPAVKLDDLDATINLGNLPSSKQPPMSSVVNKTDFITPTRPYQAQHVSKIELPPQALSFEEPETTKTSEQTSEDRVKRHTAPEIRAKVPVVQREKENSTSNVKPAAPALSSIMAKYSQKYNVQ